MKLIYIETIFLIIINLIPIYMYLKLKKMYMRYKNSTKKINYKFIEQIEKEFKNRKFELLILFIIDIIFIFFIIFFYFQHK